MGKGRSGCDSGKEGAQWVSKKFGWGGGLTEILCSVGGKRISGKKEETTRKGGKKRHWKKRLSKKVLILRVEGTGGGGTSQGFSSLYQQRGEMRHRGKNRSRRGKGERPQGREGINRVNIIGLPGWGKEETIMRLSHILSPRKKIW